MTKEKLSSLFLYKDGTLFWKIKPCKNISAGTAAGTKDKDGYLTIRYMGKHYKAHHVVYAMHTGIYPKYIDHIDRNRSNNRIENLRETTHAENMLNKGVYSNNVSGIKYIRWYRQTNKWLVRVNKTYIGYFNELSDAESALKKHLGAKA